MFLGNSLSFENLTSTYILLADLTPWSSQCVSQSTESLPAATTVKTPRPIIVLRYSDKAPFAAS